ncbi:hypothetical protein [Brevibacillus choshinensis]|uniref:hypothetical protein n=1 Tax=Brevibacillus choshinensis TaxID=54911 RepID=UPI002E21D7AE|nr:hypothetical protein [Brevibacillus choshinensis]
MPIDRKELYQKRIQDAFIRLAEYMVANSTNSIVTMRAVELRKNLRLTIHLFNEASGRLKSIGFHSGIKKFSKQQLKERQDDCIYYYQIDPECHPLKLNQDAINEAFKVRDRQKKIRQRREIETWGYILPYIHIKPENEEEEDERR